MARRLRLQFPGARYHVINRGNYRHDVFGSAGAAQAFGRTLAEAVEHHGWQVHAHATMRNHFHLAVETPEPNLAEGMHWLLGTFANRFNRFRDERGHLFQGRYHAYLVGDDAHLVRLINYIHLNPVTAGIVPVDQMVQFRWSSLRQFIRGPRPSWLRAGVLLPHLGLADDAEGWKRYVALLSELARKADSELTFTTDPWADGWAIGAPNWQSGMADAHVELANKPGVPAAEQRAFKEARWRRELMEAMHAAGKSLEDLHREPKGARVRSSLVLLQNRESIGTADGAQRLWVSSPGTNVGGFSIRRGGSSCMN